LKDRNKRTLSCEGMMHYIRMAYALDLTTPYESKIPHLYKLIDKASDNTINILDDGFPF